MRQLKISKRAANDFDSLLTQHPTSPATEAEHLSRFIVSVACQYQNQGLSLARLIEIGETAWQDAQLHYAEDSLSLARWGTWWIRQGMVRALNAETNNYPPAP